MIFSFSVTYGVRPCYRLGGACSIQLSYGGLYRKYSILQGSRIRTIRFLGGSCSIQLSYWDIYQKYSIFPPKRIRTNYRLGGSCSILLSYGCMCRKLRVFNGFWDFFRYASVFFFFRSAGRVWSGHFSCNRGAEDVKDQRSLSIPRKWDRRLLSWAARALSN